MTSKEDYRVKCDHIADILSKIRTSNVIMTSKAQDSLHIDLYCEECEKWAFGIEVGHYDAKTKTYDYGTDLEVREFKNMTEKDSRNLADFISVSLKKKNEILESSLKQCASIGCLGAVFRGRKPCESRARCCQTCQARFILNEMK